MLSTERFLVGQVGFGRSHPGHGSVRGRSDRLDLARPGRSSRSVGILIQKTSSRVREKTVF
jgi:hypothetical protein